jgi:WD40 repeat protein
MSGLKDGSMVISNLTDGQKVPINAAHSQAILALEIINDFTVVSGSSDGFIKFWNFLDGTFLNSIQNPNGGVSSLLLLKNGLLLSGDEAGLFLTGENTQTLQGHSNTVEALDLMNDGKILLSGSQDGTFKMWDISSGTLIKTIDTRTPVYSLIQTSNYLKYFVTFFPNKSS